MADREYIIQSLLDTDFYKFTMGQLVFLNHRDVPVKYAFRNRTKNVPLAEMISETDLRRELDHVRNLRFTVSDLHYLRGTNEYSKRMFREEYLEFLRRLELPPYDLKRDGDTYVLEFCGSWASAIYWEVPALAIIAELYHRAQLRELSWFKRDAVWAETIRRLDEKTDRLAELPDIRFSDFGTRRRAGYEIQDYAARFLSAKLPRQFAGTSNVHLAMKYGLLPMGTSAHELFMAMSGIMHESDESIRASHNAVLREWWDLYDYGLSIALTDTYGTDFFFGDMTDEQARSWKGLRQDSGDPFVFGGKAILFYKGRGIDPRDKMIVFSDGLDAEQMIKLHRRFSGRIKTTFGWGTNLTNDTGFRPLSLVIKLVEAGGHGAVKLSDNIAKAIGAPEDIERFKRIFRYAGSYHQECRY